MKTIFIGPLGGGKIPTNGASIKNYHILNKLKDFIKNIKIIDTENWGKKPFILVNLLTTIVFNQEAKYILSLNSGSANKLIKILKKLAPKSEVIYWVIGGSLGKWIKTGKVKAIDYSHLKNIIVEGESMKSELKESGLNNINVMSNFKKIPEVPFKLNQNEIFKFIFLSRIIPEKGCDYIIEAVKILNSEGYSETFKVDFYGPIEDSYKSTFVQNIAPLPNVSYKGFLDLRNLENYNVLAQYDAMLFPTYWPGEGFPGIIIDAYIVGLPILASDWNLNGDYIKNNETGILFKPKSIESLTDTLKSILKNEVNLNHMKLNAYKERLNYDTNLVLSKENLINNKIIDA